MKLTLEAFSLADIYLYLAVSLWSIYKCMYVCIYVYVYVYVLFVESPDTFFSFLRQSESEPTHLYCTDTYTAYFLLST